VTGLLDLAPSAWEAYQSLRANDEELSGRIKQQLEQLLDDPEAVRAGAGSRRYQIVESRLGGGPQVWSLRVAAAESDTWMIVWREMPNVIEIGYIGPAPAPCTP
jgi:hypothetical protein